MESLINDVRTYFLKCPLLKSGSALNIDFLAVDGVEYSIDSVPTNPTIETYINGAKKCQFTFCFASREHYNADSDQNLQNITFYEKLADWIYINNLYRNIPVISDNEKSAETIEVLSAGYIFDENMTTAQYQIQCRLIYLQEV